MSERTVSESNRTRWILRGAAGIGVLLAVLVGAVFFAAQRVNPDDLAAWLEPRIEAATGRDVDIGAARISLLPPVAVALEDLRISNPQGMEGDAFIQTDELRLDLDVWQLLRRRIRVDEIRLTQPQVRVVVDESGQSNARGFGSGQAPEKAPTSGEDAAPFQVDIESIRIDNGTVSYRDVGKGTAFVLAPLEARMQVRSADGDRWTLDTSVSARVGARMSQGGVDQLGPWDVEVEGSGTTENGFRTLQIEGASLALEDLLVRLAARVEQDESGGGRFTVRVQSDSVDARRLVSLLPDTASGGLPDLAGTLTIDLGLSGELGSQAPPTASGSVAFEQGRVALAGQDPVVSGLAGTWFLSKDSVWTTDTEGVALGGPLRLRGLVRLGEVDGFVMRLSAQPDLGLLSSVTTLPDSVTAAGELLLDLTARGALEDPAASSLSGRVVPDGVTLTLPGVGVPVAIPSGTVILGAEGARWSELPVRLGADDFVTSGTLTDWAAWGRGDGTVPVLDGSFRGDRFDVDEVFPAPPPDSAVLYGKLVFAALGERRIRNRTPREILEERGIFRPDSLPVGGELQLAFATLLSAPYALSDVRARVEFGPRLV
ncbi:MAG: AsmA family protein, partial [Gemmatimonadetes bacterium]|nr:AsmA family protein [Gemmatimonadota bacterium]